MPHYKKDKDYELVTFSSRGHGVSGRNHWTVVSSLEDFDTALLQKDLGYHPSGYGHFRGGVTKVPAGETHLGVVTHPYKHAMFIYSFSCATSCD